MVDVAPRTSRRDWPSSKQGCPAGGAVARRYQQLYRGKSHRQRSTDRGALNKLLAYRDLLGNQVDGEAVSRAVKDMLKKYNEFVPSPGLIVEYICRYYDVDEEQVRGQGRKRDLMEARQTAMYLIRRMTNLSLNDIGKEFGDRDHTTVLHSLDQVEKKMRSDPAYAEKVKEITTNINNKK